MFNYPPTIIIRHRRENLKKCSLTGLECRKDFHFMTYPLEKKLIATEYLLLTVDEKAPLLSKKDQERGLLFLDATWRLAGKMEANISELTYLEKRTLPQGFLTAYPRKQEDCPHPEKGLSSIEAIAISYQILGRHGEALMENYYWKDNFFSHNGKLWKSFSH